MVCMRFGVYKEARSLWEVRYAANTEIIGQTDNRNAGAGFFGGARAAESARGQEDG